MSLKDVLSKRVCVVHEPFIICVDTTEFQKKKTEFRKLSVPPTENYEDSSFQSWLAIVISATPSVHWISAMREDIGGNSFLL